MLLEVVRRIDLNFQLMAVPTTSSVWHAVTFTGDSASPTDQALVQLLQERILKSHCEKMEV